MVPPGPATPPGSLRAARLHVYRVRSLSPLSGGNQNIGGVRAVAGGPGAIRAVDCGGERAGPFLWGNLQEGKDYYVDGGGAWVPRSEEPTAELQSLAYLVCRLLL